MSDSRDKKPFGFDSVFLMVGVGLLFVALLEFTGLMRYRPHREPLGTAFWLIGGLICLGVGFLIRKLRG